MSDDNRNALPRGFLLDGYRIEKVLGEGGFGITYLAIDPIGRKVAIKEFLPKGIASRDAGDATIRPISGSDREDFAQGLERFREEAKVLLAIKHPNVVHTLRYTEAHGTAYIVMDFVEGDSLKGVLRRARTLEQSEIEEFLFPLLEGLGAVHRAGFLHRDIKPDNIYIRADNGQPVLLDFGIARMMTRGTHSVMYTPGFAPPEQHESRAPRAPSADLYALGATLYCCMAGHPPKDSRDRLLEAAFHRPDPLVPTATIAKGRYTPRLVDAVDRALRMDSAERPQSVDEFKAMILGGSASGVSERSRPFGTEPAPTTVLDEFARQPWDDKAATPDSRKAAPKPPRRAAFAAAGVAALVLAGGVATYLLTTPVETPTTAVDDPPRPASAPAAAAPQPRARSAESKRAPLEPGRAFRDCSDCPEMVVIPAGTFTMGSPESEIRQTGWSNEGPQHSVTITQFALGKYAVTRGEFAVFVRDMGYRAEKGCDVYNIAKKDWVKDVSKSWRDPGFPQTDQHPVVCVDFDDAKAYAQWLSRKTDKMYRLASEAEREYATRARTATRFFWGDDPAYGEMCRYANGWDQSVKKLNPQRETAPCNDGHIYTAPVGSFEANRFGLHDVSGNVWEWTEDTWNETYSGAPRDGRASTGGDIFRRVLRGGSWGSNPESLRSAARWRYGISGRSDVIGFRLARTLD